MLQIPIPAKEGWDEVKEEFVIISKEQILQLEHSLISISKWESKWCKPFISKRPKSYEETIDYIKCMTLNRNVDLEVYRHLTRENIAEIYKYIESPMTATYISNSNTNKTGEEKVTSELVYYWMVSLGIPIECEKWHFNRLLTLIKICNIKNQPPKKMNRRDVMSRNTSLNAARRKKLNSKG